MNAAPTGTVTFLFTDIEGSTQRWERHGVAMEAALARHNAIIAGAIEQHGGYVFKTVGDAFCAAFADAGGAVEAAVTAQRALDAERFHVGDEAEPLRVRMGIHTGLVELRDGDYLGRPVNRVARLMSAGHGGQILLSLATQQLLRDRLPEGRRLVDLGVHRLRGLEHTEHIFRLVGDGWPDVATPPDTAERLGTGGLADLEGLIVDAACPYRGLQAFREADAPFFFGREVFTGRLLDAISAKPMVGVIGPSGSGKSSVVFAGMLPKLRAAGAGGSAGDGWTVLKLRPGAEPFHALAGVVVPLLEGEISETARLVETRRMAEALLDGTLRLRHAIERAREKRDAPLRLLFVVDQFEELYTLCPDARVQRAFQDLLFETVHAVNGAAPVKLALTLRADFMGHALAYRPFADAVQDHNVVLGPMNHEELARAIAKPAELQGRAFESGLVERIIDDVGEEAGSLPLLEFALTELWEGQQAGWLTHEAYEAIGRVDGAVALHADTIIASLDAPTRQLARQVFVQLVRPGEGTEDTRRVAHREELGEDGWTLVRRLADARLVITDRDERGRETAEVVHEALIRTWGRLAEWMGEDRRFRRWQERLRFSIAQWERAGRDEGALLRGLPLAEAEQWLETKAETLPQAERDFIAASRDRRLEREAVERERIERELAMNAVLRKRAVLLALALVAAAGLALASLGLARRSARLATEARRAERLATSRELAAAALQLIDTDPELGLLLATEAVSTTLRSDDGVLPEARAALLRLLETSRLRQRLDLGDQMNGLDWSRDGRLIAVGGEGRVVLLELDADRVVRQSVVSLPTAGGGQESVADSVPDNVAGSAVLATGISLSPDASRVAVGSTDGWARVWSVRDRRWLLQEQVWVPSEGAQDIEIILDPVRVVFSPDGSRLLAGSQFGQQVAMLDVNEGRVVYTRTIGARLTGVAFSPRGDRVAWTTTEGSAHVAEAETGEPIASLRAGLSWTHHVDFSPDGMRIATAGADGYIRLWEWRDDPVPHYEELDQLLMPDQQIVRSVFFSPDGDAMLAAGGAFTGKLAMWPLAGTQRRLDLTGHLSQARFAVWSPDGRHVASIGNQDGTVRIWDVRSDHAFRTYQPENASLTDAGLSRSGRYLIMNLVTGQEDTDVVLDSSDLSAVLEWTPFPGEGRRWTDMLSDDKGVASLSMEGRFAAWALPTGTRVISQQLASESQSLPAKYLTFFSQIDDSAIYTYAVDGRIRRFDTRTHSTDVLIDTQVSLDDNQSVHMEVSPAGDRVALLQFETNASSTLSLWNGRTGSAIVEEAGDARDWGHRLYQFSPDGSKLAVGNVDGEIEIWASDTGQELLRLDNAGLVLSAKFSPDGTELLTCDQLGRSRVWSLEDGSRRLELTGSNHCNYAADGDIIITVGGDVARLWDARTGVSLLWVENANAAFLSPDGSMVLAVSEDGAVRAMPFDAETLLEQAARATTRTLTDSECRQFLHLQDGCPPQD